MSVLKTKPTRLTADTSLFSKSRNSIISDRSNQNSARGSFRSRMPSGLFVNTDKRKPEPPKREETLVTFSTKALDQGMYDIRERGTTSQINCKFILLILFFRMRARTEDWQVLEPRGYLQGQYRGLSERL